MVTVSGPSSRSVAVNAELEIRTHFAALVVSLVRAGPDYQDALEELWEWGADNLDIERDELEEALDLA